MSVWACIGRISGHPQRWPGGDIWLKDQKSDWDIFLRRNGKYGYKIVAIGKRTTNKQKTQKGSG